MSDFELGEARWQNFIKGLKTGDVYERRVEDYRTWCRDQTVISLSTDSILKYMAELYEGDILCANTLWSVVSMISTWYESHTKRKPMAEDPQIKKLLVSWAKVEAIKKAKTLEKDELFKFLRDAPNDDFWLPRKVSMVFYEKSKIRISISAISISTSMQLSLNLQELKKAKTLQSLW